MKAYRDGPFGYDVPEVFSVVYEPYSKGVDPDQPTIATGNTMVSTNLVMVRPKVLRTSISTVCIFAETTGCGGEISIISTASSLCTNLQCYQNSKDFEYSYKHIVTK
jgi:hypothetical protein